MHLSRIASEESQALGSQFSSSQRGSMILYRLAAVDDHGVLLPPHSMSPDQRDSFISTSGESIWSLSSDSKYPSGPPTMRGGLVPYVYDPSVDDQAATDEEDLLHEPDSIDKPSSLLAARGILNVGVLVLLIFSLLSLFIAYPVITYVNGNTNNLFLDETGGNTVTVPPSAFAIPQLIDSETPDSAKTRTGFDNQDYVLVFSDEFNTDGRTFYPGDDPFWEAVDLWYWATGDLEWYDPRQVYTANGSLHVRMENVVTNGMNYRSGMLQSWNKFCFTSGYIEVSLTLPGPNQETRGYVRPFLPSILYSIHPHPPFSGLASGQWVISDDQVMVQPQTAPGPTRKYLHRLCICQAFTQFHRYDSCDVGTFPNQTNPDGLGPTAALHSDASQAKYDFKLSYLTGQKLSYASFSALFTLPLFIQLFSMFFSISACTCPGEDHPGPDVTKGRGAPEIDIFEAEHNKQGDGGVISQSAQFAPFSHDYVYSNDTAQEWNVYNPSISRANNYKYVFTSLPNALLMTYDRGSAVSVAYLSLRSLLTNFSIFLPI